MRPAALVVEDHAFQRRALCRLLERAGVERPLEAEDGEAALTLLRSVDAAPLLVITDLDMPNMDGIEFIRRLAGESPELHVAIYSSQDASVLRSVYGMGEDLGVRLAGVLQKPATLAQIEALLDMVASKGTRPVRAAAPKMDVHDLRAAFADGHVVPYFQPKLRLADGKPVGCEVLARIADPRRGTLAPQHFMAVLDSERMQQQLTDRMLAGALALLTEVQRVDPALSVSVNLTLPEVSAPRDAERLAAAVSAAGMAPRSIVFEVTETAVATDWALAVENLSRLRLKGFSLSIDDFGTGYSSLQQLLQLPFSELKLDQSFVRGVAPASRAYPLVESALGMAQKLGLSTVAEGIETSAEADTLRDLHCDLGQGHAFGKPMPREEFLHWLTTHHA